jgi:hypothetical protein
MTIYFGDNKPEAEKPARQYPDLGDRVKFMTMNINGRKVLYSSAESDGEDIPVRKS